MKPSIPIILLVTAFALNLQSTYAGYLEFPQPYQVMLSHQAAFLPTFTIGPVDVKLAMFVDSFTHTIQPSLFNSQPFSLDPFVCKQVTIQENLTTPFPNLFSSSPVSAQDYESNGKLYEIFWLAPHQYGLNIANAAPANVLNILGVAEIDPATFTSRFTLPTFMSSQWQGWTPLAFMQPGLGPCAVMANRNSPTVFIFIYQNNQYLSLPVGASFIITDSISNQAAHYYIRSITGQSPVTITFTSIESYANLLYPPSLNEYTLQLTPSAMFGGSFSGTLPVLSGNIPVYVTSYPQSPTVTVSYGPVPNGNGLTVY